MESTLTTGRQSGQGFDPTLAVCIDYVNYRGERAIRRIVPKRIYFAEVEWHPGAQWVLDAWDCDKSATRTFALGDIQRWGV